MKTRSTTRACRAWQDRLLDALDAERAGGRDAAAAGELAEHLTRCPGCASELAALRRTLARLAERPLGEPPADYWPALRARVLRGLAEETPATPERAPLPARLAWGGLAAAAILLLVALFWWSQRSPELPGAPRAPIAEGQGPLPGLAALELELAAGAGELEILLDESPSLAAEDEDPDQLLEELTVTEMAALAERLASLRG
ncbi:hypothetical protein FJ251_02460 [bacterium]|nr:hypothetical protein [bacterium]